MDPATMLRRMGKLKYAAVRLPFSLLDDRVVTRYWDEDAIVRVGFERFLGTLDLLAGRLLADGAIRERGWGLWRPAGSDVWAQAIADDADEAHEAAPASPSAAPADGPVVSPADGPADGPVADPVVSPASGPAVDPADGLVADSVVSPADSPVADPADGPVADPADSPVAGPAAPSSVAVTFTLPAAVNAERVALCGDFNDWSVDSTALELGPDGSWQVTIALQPGRSYRFRYLIDGERWENAWHADGYVPNAYGGTDSVVAVE